jgi:myo-inositol-1(or 4)-monophosphatase
MLSYDETLDEARPFLRKIVYDAGEIIMRHFRTPLDMKNKIGHDIVTQADFESESLVAGAIREKFPDHSLIAEEGSRGAPESDYCWYIDPLDGTVNYAAGIPVFAVAVSLAYKHEPVLGAILDPTRDELFWAEKGKGATKNSESISVSSHDDLGDSVIYISSFALRRPHLTPYLVTTLEKLGPEIRNIVNLGSAGISWAYVAAGHIDAEISYAVDQYTGPAGILLVREAGGRATDFDGNEWFPGVPQVITSNGRVHPTMLDVIVKLPTGEP